MPRRAPALLRIYDVIKKVQIPSSADSATDDSLDESQPRTSTRSHQPIVARLHGVITAVRKAGAKRRFFDLLDPTGSVQLAAEASNFSSEEWASITSLTKGERIYIEGYVGQLSRKGQPTVILTTPPTKAELLSGTLASINPDYRNVGARLFISRIRSIVENYLENALGYLRVEARSLSASWLGSEDLNPLRVLYPGFGVPVYLSPSPSPQLIEALIATGEDRVFSSGTSFMAGYRSELDGVESAIIHARTLKLSLDDLIENGLDILKHTVTSLGLTYDGGSFSKKEYSWSDQQAPEPLGASHEIQRFRSKEHEGAVTQNSKIELFRIVQNSGVAPIEGAVEIAEGGIPLGTLSVYPERLLPLLQHMPIRRLRHLGGAEQ